MNLEVMIKFFRKIRQQLITESKLTKYLLYALGEIILVVIGILIALQLNNWNEQQKQKRLEGEYYCRLLEDAILDEEQISDLLLLAEDRLKASNQAVRLLLKDKARRVEVGTQIALSIKAIYSDFQPNNTAFVDLKSGANLNIIGDKSIVKAINRYFNKVEELKSIILVNGKYAVDILFAHRDNFANGSNQASMQSGRFSIGMEEDVFDAIKIDENQILSDQMKSRLYSEALEYLSVNTRNLGLYKDMLAEVRDLEDLLRSRCLLRLEQN